MSRSVYTGDNGCPLGNSIVKNTTLLPLSPIDIWGMLLVNNIDIMPHLNYFKKQLCNLYHKYFSNICLGYSLCADTELQKLHEPMALLTNRIKINTAIWK